MPVSIRAIENGLEVTNTSTGETIVIEADDVRRITNDRVRGAFDRITEALTAFEATGDGAPAFGSGPGAELAALHAQTKQVYVRTVGGVGEDLDSFGLNLMQAADNWDAADLSSSERSTNLANLLQAYDQAPSAAQNQFDTARADAGEGLVMDGELQERLEQLEEEAAQAEGGAGAGEGGEVQAGAAVPEAAPDQ